MSLEGRKLDGETAFITGASAGIGAACALRLAECGAKIVLGARREDRQREVADQIRTATRAEVTALPLDVTDGESISAWLEEGQNIAGPCSILVNNAGLAAGADHVATSRPSDWDRMLRTNVQGAFEVTRQAVPGMLERGRGDIVMMASVAGFDAYPGGAVYCATKAALQQFAAALRKELLGEPVRVLTFNPGMVETEFSAVRLGDKERAKQVYRGMTPLTPEDIADCVAFSVTRPLHMSIDSMLILATDQSSATTVHRREES